MRTFVQIPQHSKLAGFLAETLLLLLYILAISLLYALRMVSLNGVIICFDILVIFLLIWSWKRLNGGLHPCWLLLLAIGFFQGGALLGFLFGSTTDPFVVTLMFTSPISISEPYEVETILSVALAMVFVYLPCAYRFSPTTYTPMFSLRVRQVAKYIFYGFLPFEFYKVWVYVRFVQSHGGYAANLLLNDELRMAAGTPVRLASFVCTSAFYLLLLVENRTAVLKYVYIAFISTLLLSLGIGDRGGVLTRLVLIWYIQKFKTGNQFKFKTLLIVGSIGAILSSFIGQLRSNEKIEGTMNVMHFITGQGVSLQVTELAVARRAEFGSHAVSYLIHGAGLGTGERRSGQLFDQDLASYLSNVRVEQGLGTGSSFIAEAFLLGGLLGVIIVSTCIGFALRKMYEVSGRKYGLVPTIMFLPAIVFMPRAEILSPIHSGLKIGTGMALVGMAAYFLSMFFALFTRSAPEGQVPPRAVIQQ